MNAIDVDTALGWRGATVVDRDGEKIGKLEEVYLDEDDRPGWGAVHTGMFGLKRTFVPLYDAQADEECVRVPHTKDHVRDAPSIDPDVQLAPDEEERLYDHYGRTMTRTEEEPVVTETRRVPRERVRIKKVLVTEHVPKTMALEREKVDLEREPPADHS